MRCDFNSSSNERNELRANIVALVEFETSPDRQMPDVIGLMDLRWLIHNAPRTQPFIGLLDRQYHDNPYGTRWGARKDDRSCRDMVLANPFAEIHMRRLMCSDATTLEGAQTRLALSGRVELKPFTKVGASALATQPHRPAHGAFRKRLGEIRASAAEHGLKTDIHRFYPSVQPEHVSLAWRRRIGNSTGLQIALALTECEADTGVPGLPIGPETSAWLANILLAQSDLVLDQFPQILAVRWSDDHILANGSPRIIEAGYRALCRSIASLDLSTSAEKTKRTWVPEDEITLEEMLDETSVSQGDLNLISGFQGLEPDG